MGLAGGIGAANLPDTTGMTFSGSDQVVDQIPADDDASSSMFPKEEMKTKAIEIENLFNKAKKLKKKANRRRAKSCR